MHGRASNFHLVEALQVSRNSSCPEVIVLPQIQDLADYRTGGCPRRVVRCAWPVSQTGFTEFIKTTLPAVERCPRYSEVSTGLRNVPWLFLCVFKDSQPPGQILACSAFVMLLSL
jgi:hypothetical protein